MLNLILKHMKKILLALASMAMAFSVSAQEFVSTEPSNRNVILEEFTGINCGYCPDGHRMANELMAANPGRVWAINIHVGSYAANTFTTEWGTALMNAAQVTGFPTGWVNRQGAAQSRSAWASSAATIMGQASDVNIAARCIIDYEARTMHLTTEMYYTGNGSATYYLNAAILQNNVLGPQGGSSYNPDQIEGSQYRHMHMLRHLITGQWGQAYSFSAEEPFQSLDTTFTLPASYGTPTPVDVVMEDLNVVCFLAEGHTNIVTGCEAQMSIMNGTPNIKKVDAAMQDCDGNVEAVVTVNNMGNDAITAMEITYTVNGTALTYNWSGNIAPGQVEEVALPLFNDNVNPGNNTITFQITSLNGESFSSNIKNVSVNFNSIAAERYLSLQIKTDAYGSEASWIFRKADGTIIRRSPVYANAARTYDYYLTVPEDGCYVFEYTDSYGDGFTSSGQWVRLSDVEGNVLFQLAGSAIGSGFTLFTGITNHEDVSINEQSASPVVALYPNPATTQVTIAAEQMEEVKVVNALGQVVYTAQVNGNELVLNTSDFAAGLYVATVRTANGTSTQRFSVVR